ncbi:MAG TPA: hypothetical protein VGW75_06365 [Solirubrobacteraceae bacterium]|jgi:hypothetical protein|nr:hypothetical protein [Solirubrobacteraceae bacterium]
MRTLQPPALPDAEARAGRMRGPLVAELRRSVPAPALERRRRRTRVAYVAAAVAVVAATTPAILPRDATTPALAVERDDGWLVLRIADVAAGQEALTQELRDAGIRGEVRLLPVQEEDAGTWAVIAELADPPGTPLPPPGSDRAQERGEHTVRLGSVRYERETLRVPVAEVRESTGYFVFYAGREARPGEDLWRDRDIVFRR